MLAITICATKNYTYAMRAQARRVAANVGQEKATLILSGDDSPEIRAVADYYKQIAPHWEIRRLKSKDAADGHENYKEAAQLLIGRLRSAAFTEARTIGATECWSLDSDTLPPYNALRCMRDMLTFDAGYYSIAACPYPNTSFLGGFGSPMHNINEDFLQKERKVPEELQKEWEANEAEAKALGVAKTAPTKEQREKWDATNKKIKECPPDGNIWEVNGKHGWRRRGWLDNAYPAIGLGAVVPVDWVGFGCTLMNQQALALADFTGYEGKGTEDLFICWHRWHPAGLRLNTITHCPCDHVIWGKKKKDGDAAVYTLHQAYHEQMGEHYGHLRTRQIPWTPESL